MAVSAVPTTPECLSVAPKIKYAYPEFDFGLKINSERRKKSGHKKIIGPRPGAPPPQLGPLVTLMRKLHINTLCINMY